VPQHSVSFQRAAALTQILATAFIAGCAQYVVIESSTTQKQGCPDDAKSDSCERLQKARDSLVSANLSPTSPTYATYARTAASLVNGWVTYLPWPRSSESSSDLYVTDAEAGMKLDLLFVGSTAESPANPRGIGSLSWIFDPKKIAPEPTSSMADQKATAQNNNLRNSWPPYVSPSSFDYAFLQIIRTLGNSDEDEDARKAYIEHLPDRICTAAQQPDCSHPSTAPFPSPENERREAEAFQHRVMDSALGFSAIRVFVDDVQAATQADDDYQMTADRLATRLCVNNAETFEKSRSASASTISLIGDFRDSQNPQKIISLKLTSRLDIFGANAVGTNGYGLYIRAFNPVRVANERIVRFVSPCVSVQQIEVDWKVRVLGIRRSMRYFCKKPDGTPEGTCPLIDSHDAKNSIVGSAARNALLRASDGYFSIGFDKSIARLDAKKYLRLPAASRSSLVLASGDVLIVEPERSSDLHWIPIPE
jgi:hypothetical protein